MLRFFAILALAALSLAPLSSTGVADQNDARLGPLFEILLNAPENSPDAHAAQETIWAIWLEAPTASGRILMKQGLQQMHQMDHTGAITTFSALIEFTPNFAEAWNKRATLHYLQGNFADSLADIDETLKLEPRHFGAQSGMGLVFDAMEEWEAAIDAYEKALRINPHMPQIATRLEQLREEMKGREL